MAGEARSGLGMQHTTGGMHLGAWVAIAQSAPCGLALALTLCGELQLMGGDLHLHGS